MTATEGWTLTPVAHRGGVVEELDVRAECSDGRSGIVTLMRWPAGWRVPLHLDLHPKMARCLLRIARESVFW
jgi:hypothetical protein